MTTKQRRTENDRLRQRMLLVLRMERDGLRNFVIATALAAPIALIATDGVLFIVGIA